MSFDQSAAETACAGQTIRMILAPTGVRIQLPGRDGVWRPMTAIFSLLHAAYDGPGSKKVTGVKDKYTDMPMFCIRCAGDIASAA